MARGPFGQCGLVDVHATEVQSRGFTAVQLVVQRGEHHPAGAVDRPFGDRDQVEVTDSRDIVPGGQRPSHPEVADPGELPQPVGERGNRGCGHRAGSGSMIGGRRPCLTATLRTRLTWRRYARDGRRIEPPRKWVRVQGQGRMS